MTKERFGSGEFFTPWGLNDEVTFTARERFVDLLVELAPKARESFNSMVGPVLDEVFIVWPKAPDLDEESIQAMYGVASRHGVALPPTPHEKDQEKHWQFIHDFVPLYLQHQLDPWPEVPKGDAESVLQAVEKAAMDPRIDVAFPPDPAGDHRRQYLEAINEIIRYSGFPYSLAFGFIPPTPDGFYGSLTVEGDHDDFVRERSKLEWAWWRAWQFIRQLASILLRDQLDSWSRPHERLRHNPWVASHLLARGCKARLCHTTDARLDHVTFPHPFQELNGLASFGECFAESFAALREWEPTRQEWSAWKQKAVACFRDALADYRRRVQERATGSIQEGGLGLKRVPGKRKDDNFRRLIRWAVLGKTQREIADEDGVDEKKVNVSIGRACELLRFVH